jgi:hypothetical protein
MRTILFYPHGMKAKLFSGHLARTKVMIASGLKKSYITATCDSVGSSSGTDHERGMILELYNGPTFYRRTLSKDKLVIENPR